MSWRSEGIRYRKNEVFLDVIESVNLLVNGPFPIQHTHTRLTGKAGQCERRSHPFGNPRRGQDEMLLVWHAGASVGLERQGHV